MAAAFNRHKLDLVFALGNDVWVNLGANVPVLFHDFLLLILWVKLSPDLLRFVFSLLNPNQDYAPISVQKATNCPFKIVGAIFIVGRQVIFVFESKTLGVINLLIFVKEPPAARHDVLYCLQINRINFPPPLFPYLSWILNIFLNTKVRVLGRLNNRAKSVADTFECQSLQKARTKFCENESKLSFQHGQRILLLFRSHIRIFHLVLQLKRLFQENYEL